MRCTRMLLTAVPALAIALLLQCGTGVVAKPPPPPGAPWATYAMKPGMVMRRSPVGAASAAPGFAFGPALGGASSPMSPFLKLKPFLPAKPSFMPPVVDPSQFIDMKTDLLNSLFSGLSAPPGAPPADQSATSPSPSLSSRALFSPFAVPGPFMGPSPYAAPSPVVKPPPPAFLADLFKALNINKTVANASDTQPAGFPFAPAPVVDPGVLISNKAKFLSDLFASLSTTTPPPPAVTTSASIVPSDFWLPDDTSEPAAPEVDPASYAEKVSVFLDRLFDSLNISQLSASKRATADPTLSETEKAENLKYQFLERAAEQDTPEDEQQALYRAKRSVDPTGDDPVALLADAKDKVVDTIIGELASLKNSMVGAVTDLAQAQKAAAAQSTTADGPAAKKPLSPFAAMWAKPGKPTPGAATTAAPTPAIEPVQQRVALLGQVFDMLTAMEKDITKAMVVPTSADTPGPTTTAAPVDLMEAVKAKFHQIMAQNTSDAINQTTSSVTTRKAVRLVSEGPSPAPADPSFWIPDTISVGPEAYLAKTKEFLSNIMAAKATSPSPIMRRSYKWYDQQRQEKQSTDQQQPILSQQQLPQQPTPTNGQDTPKSLKDRLMEFYKERHHHHHNRQPYWWN